jgi:hypothetical protein
MAQQYQQTMTYVKMSVLRLTTSCTRTGFHATDFEVISTSDVSFTETCTCESDCNCSVCDRGRRVERKKQSIPKEIFLYFDCRFETYECAEKCTGPIPSLGKEQKLLPELGIEGVSYISTNSKNIDTEALKRVKVEPVVPVSSGINQVIGHVAFSDVTTYFIDKQPIRRQNLETYIRIIQAIVFARKDPVA